MFKKKRTFLLSCRMVPKHTYVQVLMWAYLAFLLWDGSHGYPVTSICCDVQCFPCISENCGMIPTVLVCLESCLLWPFLAAFQWHAHYANFVEGSATPLCSTEGATTSSSCSWGTQTVWRNCCWWGLSGERQPYMSFVEGIAGNYGVRKNCSSFDKGWLLVMEAFGSFHQISLCPVTFQIYSSRVWTHNSGS